MEAYVTGFEFERRVRRLGKWAGVEVSFDPAKGKGSHGRLRYGASSTTLKDRGKEIGKGLLTEMCKQLGIDPRSI